MRNRIKDMSAAALLASPPGTWAAPRPWAWPGWRQPVLPAPPQSTTATVAVVNPEVDELLAAQRGSASAFEALVRRFQGPLYNFSLRLLGREDDAADVVQETFVQFYTHIADLRAGEPIAPWLFRVARNRAIDVIRRRRTVPIALPADDEEPHAELSDHDPLPDVLAERADLQRLLTAAIAGLPPVYAEVVALRYAADRSFAEIAAILECDEGTARVRFHRAKPLLRARLRAELEMGLEV